MQHNTPTNSEPIAVSPPVDPLAVYQALWQDGRIGHAVLIETEEHQFCLASMNDALKKAPLWQVTYGAFNGTASKTASKTTSPECLSTAEVVGKNISDVFSEYCVQQFYPHCCDCLHTQQTVRFELPFLTENEPSQWWEFTLSPILDRDRSPFKRNAQLVVTAKDISGFRQTEHDLKQEAQDIRTVWDNIQEASFVHDTTSKILDVNESALALHGVTREEAMRYSIDKEYAAPDSPIHLLPELWQRTLEGELVSIDWPISRLADGQRRVMEVVLKKVVLNGQDRVVSCLRDVTERKELEEKQNRLLAILEATPDLVGMADAEGNSVYLNSAGQKLLGIPAEEATSFHISEAIPVWAQETFFKGAMSQAVAQGSWSGEQILINRAGKEFPISQVLISHKDAAGELQYLSAIMRDVSDFKLTEAALRDQQQFLDSIYRGANVVMFAWDLIDQAKRELRCSGWNPACAETTGLSEAQVLGKTPVDVFGPEAGGTMIERQLQCIEQQQSIEYEEEIVLDDSPTWWTTKLNPIRDEAGKIYRVVGTTTNITEARLHTIELEAYSKLQSQQAKALEAALKELKQTQAQIVHSEKMSSLGQMVAGIAHEINNPVNFIHANVKPARAYASELLELVALYQQEYPQPSPALSEMLEDLDIEFVQKDFVELLESMKVGTQRIREIVLSLRNFSRLDEADVKAVDLHQGIDSTLVILSHKLKMNSVQKPVTVNKSYELLPLVECYPSQLNQVVMNIVANAIDAVSAHEQPQICIATQAQGNQAVITIVDNGGGIPEAARAQIFDPFFTTKPVGKGTGMGLSISHQIITERHGGTLTVDSEPGKGTIFTIKIPLKQGASI
ncbi:MAG: PAS domain S-box protein [Phormidesmis sp.]